MENNEFFNRGLLSFIITILLVLLGGLIYNKCTDNSLLKAINKDNTTEIIKTKIDTIYLTKVITKYVKGKDIYHTDVIVKKNDTIFLTKLDTIKIVEDYSTHRLYIDTLKLENGSIIIKDTLFKNKIESRYWVSNIKEKIINKETFIKPPLKNSFYFGINLFQEKPFKINNISTSILYKSRKDEIFVLSLGLDKNRQPILGTSYFIKIK